MTSAALISGYRRGSNSFWNVWVAQELARLSSALASVAEVRPSLEDPQGAASMLAPSGPELFLTLARAATYWHRQQAYV